MSEENQERLLSASSILQALAPGPSREHRLTDELMRHESGRTMESPMCFCTSRTMKNLKAHASRAIKSGGREACVLRDTFKEGKYVTTSL